jgi:ribosomal protein L37E
MTTVQEPRCETCGRNTYKLPVKVCGECATNWNTPGGKASINRRRKQNGLPPLETR